MANWLKDSGVTFTSGRYITRGYLRRHPSLRRVNIKELFDKYVESGQIIVANQAEINVQKGLMSHYTYNDLPDNIPIDILDGTSEIVDEKSSPKARILEAQSEIDTAFDDGLYKGIVNEIKYTEKGIDFAEKIIQKSIGDIDIEQEDDRNRLVEDLRKLLGIENIDMEHIVSLYQLNQRGYKIKDDKLDKLKDQKEYIETTITDVNRYSRKQLSAVNSINAKTLAKTWTPVKGLPEYRHS